MGVKMKICLPEYGDLKLLKELRTIKFFNTKGICEKCGKEKRRDV